MEELEIYFNLFVMTLCSPHLTLDGSRYHSAIHKHKWEQIGSLIPNTYYMNVSPYLIQ